MKWLVGIIVTTVAGAALAAPGAAASAAASPVYSTNFTINGLGPTPVTGTAAGFSFEATRTGIRATLNLAVSDAATQVLIQAAHQGTAPSAAGFTVKASGVTLAKMAVAKPTLAVAQQVSGTAQIETVQFTAKSFAWKTVHPWHPAVASATGMLSVTATAGSQPATVQVSSASVEAAASGRPVTLDTQEPFATNVSGALWHALGAGTPLSRVALSEYKPGTRTAGVIDTATAATVLGIQETVSRAAFTDQVTLGSATAAMTTPGTMHPAVRNSPGVLQVPATATTPAMSIHLADVAATLAGKPQLVTTEPVDTSISPNLLKLVGVPVSATLVLYAKSGGSKVVGRYALSGLRLTQLRETAGPGGLDDTVTFSIAQSSWTPPAYQQAPPVNPAAAIIVPSKPAADSLAGGVSITVTPSSQPASPAIKASVTEPANPALSSFLLTAAKGGTTIPEVSLALFRPGSTTNRTVTYKLQTVRVRTVAEGSTESLLEDQFTLTARKVSIAASGHWHGRESHPAGFLQLNGQPLPVGISYGSVNASPAGVSIDTTEPFDTDTTSALLDALISGQQLPGASVTWVQPGTTSAAVSYSTSSPGIKQFTESADGTSTTDAVDWAFPGMTETPTAWQGPVAQPAGSLAIAVPPQSETTVPVKSGTLSAHNKILTAGLQLPFDSTLSPDFLQAALAGGTSTADGVLSVYSPGTTTTTEAYGLSAPAVAFTETVSRSSLTDAVTMTDNSWSYG